MTKPLDLDAIDKKWLGICGACDAGIGPCTHPSDDYRPTMLRLVQEVHALRADLSERVAILTPIADMLFPLGGVPQVPFTSMYDLPQIVAWLLRGCDRDWDKSDDENYIRLAVNQFANLEQRAATPEPTP